MRDAKKQNHVSKSGFGSRGKPAINGFTEHAILLHRLAPRNCKWSGAELESPAKSLPTPWRVLLVIALDPIPHPGKVRATKQVNHEKPNARIAGGYEGVLEFRIH